MKNDRKIRAGQMRDWVGLEGERCLILSYNDTQVIVKYLKSDEGEGTYTYPINLFMEKTIVVM